MSVCYNKLRKKYFICYDYKMPDGSFKTMSIYNKEWTKERGKKFVQAIEQEEIAKDIKKRKLFIHTGPDIIFEELFEMYMTDVNLHFAEQTAYNKRLGIQKYFINEGILHKKLNDVFTVANIERFKARITTSGYQHHCINNIMRYIKDLMTFASEREYITYELCKKLSNLLKPISNKTTYNENNETKIKFWTNEEWDKFYLSFKEDDYWRLFFEVSYKAGLRIGEAIGLKFSDLNINNNSIFIRRAILLNGEISSPKNKSSIAPVSIPKSLVEKLLKLKEVSCATDDDFIFFAWKRVSRSSIRNQLNQHIKLSGVPLITPHGLRHSCASRMINMRLSPLIVSKHLRHASVKETLDTYSHLFPSETEDIIEKIFD